MVYLIDYENTSYLGLTGIDTLNKEDLVIIFHSGQYISKKMMDIIPVCQIKEISLKQRGKNGLDFYIATKVGEILSKNPKERVAIISKDCGYQAVKDFADVEYKTSIVLATNICTANYLSTKKITSEFYYKNEDNPKKKFKESVLIANLPNNLHTRDVENKNKELCNIAKVDVTEGSLVKIYNESLSSMGLYNKLLHKYGKQKGHKVYHLLKDAGYCKEKKNNCL